MKAIIILSLLVSISQICFAVQQQKSKPQSSMHGSNSESANNGDSEEGRDYDSNNENVFLQLLWPTGSQQVADPDDSESQLGESSEEDMVSASPDGDASAEVEQPQEQDEVDKPVAKAKVTSSPENEQTSKTNPSDDSENQEHTRDEMPDGQLDDNNSSEDSEGESGMFIVFVPILKVLERTVYYVIRQPINDVENANYESLKADSLILFMTIIGCVLFLFILAVFINRAIMQCRRSRNVAQAKYGRMSPPTYVPSPQNGSMMLNTKIDNHNIIPEKPPLDP